MDPLRYFTFFKYVPTLEEYQRFSIKRTIPKECSIINGRVVNQDNQKYLSGTLKRHKISLNKIKRKAWVLKLIGALPWVQYLGISGTVSMLNASQKDDIDLFIITKAGALWVARFWIILLTTILRTRRKPKTQNYQDKICLNLFFSEANLKIPKEKQTVYVAHEILQLQTLTNKNQTYEHFLQENSWVFILFPHAQKKTFLKKINKKQIWVNKIGIGEKCLRVLQLFLINRHKTKETITETQLWFFPKDFAEKMKPDLNRGK